MEIQKVMSKLDEYEENLSELKCIWNIVCWPLRKAKEWIG